MNHGHERLAIGIDFGGTTVKFGVCAGAEVIASAGPIDTTAFYSRPPDDLITAIGARVNELKLGFPAVRAVGVGVPGLVDFDRGHVHDITNVPGWQDIPLRERLEGETGLPVAVDNDANCMAYAEHHHGAGAGFRHVIAITLGTGVGGGLIIDGKLHRGSQFCAGEAGQISIDYQGAPDIFGMPGIVEKFIGNREIATHAAKLYARGGQGMSADRCTPKALATAAAAGDAVANEVWRDFASWLGTALASAIWLLNPDAIIIGGGVADAGPVLFAPLSEKLRSVLPPVLTDHLHLLPAKFGNEAGIIGSAAQALDALGGAC
jgi:glucokinase